MKTLTLTTEDIVRLYYTIPVQNRIAERPEGWTRHLNELYENASIEKINIFKEILQWLVNNNYYICLPAMPDWFLKKHHMKLDDFTGFKLQLETLDFPFKDSQQNARITDILKTIQAQQWEKGERIFDIWFDNWTGFVTKGENG